MRTRTLLTKQVALQGQGTACDLGDHEQKLSMYLAHDFYVCFLIFTAKRTTYMYLHVIACMILYPSGVLAAISKKRRWIQPLKQEEVSCPASHSFYDHTLTMGLRPLEWQRLPQELTSYLLFLIVPRVFLFLMFLMSHIYLYFVAPSQACLSLSNQ